MFKKITAATVLISGLFVASSVHAANVSVEQLVGSLISQAVSVTKEEISYGVEEAILTVNNSIGFESDSQDYVTNVTITDLNSDTELKKEESDKAE
ncbi:MULTISPECIES: hypothetical protein [Alteromonadaceae]|uniref:hypothetical protein n=1 Tax=Alteromonadaceae TaxID=72275 RepID=UPI001C0872EA|nr:MULTISPECIES: hypothetical protein [Aliiglaciecola]MBU2878630.1 hypothetical protein [Aliiglaciecola lipolytica]MDO6709541.1 hypothetical protein [Aliiglaciecola sp. 2_MG-2023]MDO6750917.1 hypothetical protein [Aliiglaciecola sp. 1_MG-2023]